MTGLSPSDEGNALLTGREVARLLRVSDRTISRYAVRGVLFAVEVGGVRRYRREDINALLRPVMSEAAEAQSSGSATPADVAADDVRSA